MHLPSVHLLCFTLPGMDLTEPVTLQVGKEGTLLHTKMFIVLALIGNIQADTF